MSVLLIFVLLGILPIQCKINFEISKIENKQDKKVLFESTYSVCYFNEICFHRTCQSDRMRETIEGIARVKLNKFLSLFHNCLKNKSETWKKFTHKCSKTITKTDCEKLKVFCIKLENKEQIRYLNSLDKGDSCLLLIHHTVNQTFCKFQDGEILHKQKEWILCTCQNFGNKDYQKRRYVLVFILKNLSTKSPFPYAKENLSNYTLCAPFKSIERYFSNPKLFYNWFPELKTFCYQTFCRLLLGFSLKGDDAYQWNSKREKLPLTSPSASRISPTIVWRPRLENISGLFARRKARITPPQNKKPTPGTQVFWPHSKGRLEVIRARGIVQLPRAETGNNNRHLGLRKWKPTKNFGKKKPYWGFQNDSQVKKRSKRSAAHFALQDIDSLAYFDSFSLAAKEVFEPSEPPKQRKETKLSEVETLRVNSLEPIKKTHLRHLRSKRRKGNFK